MNYKDNTRTNRGGYESKREGGFNRNNQRGTRRPDDNKFRGRTNNGGFNKFKSRENNFASNDQAQQAAPTSYIDAFLTAIKDVVNQKTSENVSIKVLEGTKKKNDCGVFVKLTLRKNNTPEGEKPTENSIVFYYTEDHSVNPKRAMPKAYNASILIINQRTNDILFNKYGQNCLEKSQKYIEGIIEKNIAFLENGKTEK